MHKEKGIWVFSEAEKIILMQQYADGASIIDISLSTNVNASTIMRNLRYWGVSMRPAHYQTVRSKEKISVSAIRIAGANRIGKFHSEESKKQMSETHNRRLAAGEIKRVNGMRGRKHTKETIDLYSLVRKGANNGMFGKKRSAEFKENAREFGIKGCRSQKHALTSIELKVMNELKRLDIEYISQYRVENFLYDLYISRWNLLIECDGDYWHSLEKAIERDKLKDECAKRNGFKLLRLKEKTIKSYDFDLREYLLEVEMMQNE